MIQFSLDWNGCNLLTWEDESIMESCTELCRIVTLDEVKFRKKM